MNGGGTNDISVQCAFCFLQKMQPVIRSKEEYATHGE